MIYKGMVLCVHLRGAGHSFDNCLWDSAGIQRCLWGESLWFLPYAYEVFMNDLVRDHSIRPVWAVGKKVSRGLWERENDLYIVDSFGEGLRLSIVRNDMNYHLMISWSIIMLCMHWSKLPTLIIIEVKSPNKSNYEFDVFATILREFWITYKLRR